jgi:hypothetical protein
MAANNTQADHIAAQTEFQRRFLQDGGIYRGALTNGYANGTLTRPGEYVHQDYPKYLKLVTGDVIVQDAEEESKMLGKSPLAAPASSAAVQDDDSIEALELRLADMKKKAALRREIAELAAQEAVEAAEAPVEVTEAVDTKRPTLSLSTSKPSKAA